jgi:tetratricopeptide (TPR) repeat protein
MNYDGTLKQELPERTAQNMDYRPPFHNYIILPEDLTDFNWQAALFEVATLVDTSLFRAYMLARPTLAGSLFRLDNFCDPDVVNAKLYESGRYGDLIDFLHGKKLHREALEVLAKFGKGEAKEEVAQDLRGPQRTVGYLQQLPPELIDMILEFAEWPLKEDADVGMQVFLADTENAETLPRHRVLEFLQKIDSKLGVTYLEHIIYELNDQTPGFHQDLLDAYLERLKAEDGKFKDDDEKLEWRIRLERLLRSSAQYNRAKALKHLPPNGMHAFLHLIIIFTNRTFADPNLFESRAIVLSQMGNHRQALQIYVFQIKDHQKAEDYCNRQYIIDSTNVTDTNGAHHGSAKANQIAHPGITPTLVPASDGEDLEPSIYHTLLSLYLTPPKPHEAQWAPALDLLSKHGARLPASSTLEIIPPTLPVKELESYFRGRIRSANTAMNEDRIRARLEGVEKANIEAKLLLGVRGRKVVVGEERLCGVCGKRFGGSAVRVYPDGGVVHYGCLRGGRNTAAVGGVKRNW